MESSLHRQTGKKRRKPGMKAMIREEVRRKTTVGRPLHTGPFQTHGRAELDRECKRIPRRAVRGTRQRVHCQALRTVEAYSMHMCEPDTVQTRSRQVPTMSVSLKMPLRRSNFESLRTGDLGCFQEALLQSESAVTSASLPSCFKPMVSKSQGAL